MKTKVWIMALLLIVSGFSMKLVAQENLNALVKKCETMPSVNMNIIRKQNTKTKKLELKIIDIDIKEDQALINEFLEAFKKDEANAIQAIEDKKAGKTTSLFYKFENVSYDFSYGKKEGCASVSVMYGSMQIFSSTKSGNDDEIRIEKEE